jgi:CheY-like chemotaxis protein
MSATGFPPLDHRRLARASHQDAAPPVKILLVEDDTLVADTLARMLGVDHHHVEFATDGLEALELVRAGEYDAILCDIRMPRLDGLGFYTALGRTCPDLVRRVVFVTADAENPEIRRFFATTGTLWLPKPTSLAGLRRVLEQLAGA